MLQLCTRSEAREMCQTDIVEERLGKNDKSFASSENLNRIHKKKKERATIFQEINKQLSRDVIRY